jgi:hypothetical protein
MTSYRHSAAVFACVATAWLGSAGRAGADEVRGVLRDVDPAKKEIRVEGRGRDRGATLTFVLDDKTLILFGREKGAASDLQTGRRVRVEFEDAGEGRHVARVIRAAGRPAATAVAAPVAVSTPAAPADGIAGVLQRVSRADREIVVIGPGPKGPETETTVAVPESTKIVKDGKPSSLEALREGDSVAVRTERRDGRPSALEVQVGPGATVAGPAPTPESGRVISRIRQALHMADEVLRRVDPEGGDGARKP